MTLRKHLLLAGGALAALAGATTGARAQGYPTVDVGAISQLQQVSGFASETVGQLNQVRDLTKGVQDAVGATGIRDGMGLLGEMKGFALGGDYLATLKDMVPFGGQGDDAMPTDGVTPESFDTLAKARTWVKTTFYKAGQATAEDARQYGELRYRAARDAALNGYSLALVSRAQLAKSADRAKTLEDMVGATKDLRDDVRANSYVLLAQHQQIAQLTATLTAMLEIEATTGLQSDADIVGMGGGAKPTPVRVAGDYTINNQRIHVTAPATSTSGEVLPWQQGIQSALGNGMTPRIQQAMGAASGRTDVLGMLNAGASLAGSGGNSQLGGLLGGLGQYAQGGNVTGMVLAGAASLASSKGSSMAGILSTAQSALTSNDPTSVNNLLRMAQSAARTSGNNSQLSMLNDAQRVFAAGGNPDQAVFAATSVIAQSRGESDISQLLSTGQRLAGTDANDPSRMMQATSSVLSTAGSMNRDADLTAFGRAASSMSSYAPRATATYASSPALPQTPQQLQQLAPSTQGINPGAWQNPDAVAPAQAATGQAAPAWQNPDLAR